MFLNLLLVISNIHLGTTTTTSLFVCNSCGSTVSGTASIYGVTYPDYYTSFPGIGGANTYCSYYYTSGTRGSGPGAALVSVDGHGFGAGNGVGTGAHTCTAFCGGNVNCRYCCQCCCNGDTPIYPFHAAGACTISIG